MQQRRRRLRQTRSDVRKKKVETDKKRRKEEAEHERNVCKQVGEWENDIFPQWDGVKDSKRVRKLWLEGVPEKVRADLWRLAIGNSLQITPDLYNIFRQRGVAVREAMRKGIARTAEEEAEQTALESIDIDLPRTFPSFQFFQEGPLMESLASILEAYVQYRPDVGYAQGMSYVVAMMLLHMNADDVFISLANLLHQSHLLSFFRVVPQEIGVYLRVYDLAFSDALPALYSHFTSIGLHPQFYVYDWFITVFSKSLPINIACCIWDLFLMHPCWLYKSALGLLLHFEKDLVGGSFDACFHLLTHLPKDIDQARLLNLIKSVRLSRKKYESIHKKACAMDNSCFIPMA
eukprot:TRINITY_DN4723_c0_g1_i2.p1 TRINITY_DN4723_c0_g1~~TRINITY_DN4723_c0_g1_i2.p1  ORF type:complete len:347 (+),score=69.64 TRINITY_DN4723_c0_g1_i2:354-1394(+)